MKIKASNFTKSYVCMKLQDKGLSKDSAIEVTKEVFSFLPNEDNFLKALQEYTIIK